MNDYDVRGITERNIKRELNNLANNYMKIYDEYYETGSRDSAFLKDLAESILGISAVLEVYTRDKEIYPDYAIEKIEFSKRLIDRVINYYSAKKENED